MRTRNTKQQRIAVEEIGKMDGFFSAKELHERMLERDRRIGIATVYRLLRDMDNEGRIYSYACDRKRVYSKEKRSHCHFICENTGRIIHFDVDSIDFLRNKIPGNIRSFQLEVRGVCRDCKGSGCTEA